MENKRLSQSRPQRLLYITHRVPYPPDKGDRIRNFRVLRHLSQDARVSLACLQDEPTNEQTLTTLQHHCESVGYVRTGPMRWLRAGCALLTGGSASVGACSLGTMRRLIRSWVRSEPFDAVLVSASSLTSYLRMPELAGVPTFVDLVDVDSQKWADYAARTRGPKGLLYRWESRRLRQVEQLLPAWTRGVFLVTQAEAELFRTFCSPGDVHVVPNGVDLEYFRPRPQADTSGCVFVGAFDYRPNIDAACWFVEEIWPGIRRRRPEETLRLVGRKPVAAVQRLAAVPGVEVVGSVPDVRPYLAAASLAVTPLRMARGVQNKVLEALAMGKATVVSPPATAGLQVDLGRDVCLAQSAEEWVDQCVNLLGCPQRRQALGQAGRAYVETHHSWEACLAPMTAALGLQNSLGDSATGTSTRTPLVAQRSSAPMLGS